VTALLEVRSLSKEYPVLSPVLRARTGSSMAVDGIDLTIEAGEIVALVGESGSGKSTLARLILRLAAPSSGEIRWRGEDWLKIAPRELRHRRRAIQPVFQDPQTALDPRQTVGAALQEPIRIHRLARSRRGSGVVGHLLSEVGLDAKLAGRYPHELSGGQRQRVVLARALASEPDLLVADEPLASLDASVRAQIANLLLDLRERRRLAILLVSHDLALVGRMADRALVLYRGRVVEEGPIASLLAAPRHPCTAAMIADRPDLKRGRPAPKPAGGWRRADRGAPVHGCPYLPACPVSEERCRREAPVLEFGLPGHGVACHFPGRLGIPAASERMEPFPRPDVKRSDADRGATERGIER